MNRFKLIFDKKNRNPGARRGESGKLKQYKEKRGDLSMKPAGYQDQGYRHE